MSLSNIRDSMVKNTFVTDHAARGTELQRIQEAAAEQARREQARQADEVIVQLSRMAEQNAVREDDERRRNQREEEEEEKEEERPPRPPPEDETPPPRNVGSHRLDIVV